MINIARGSHHKVIEFNVFLSSGVITVTKSGI